jgi:hypothetical protein
MLGAFVCVCAKRAICVYLFLCNAAAHHHTHTHTLTYTTHACTYSSLQLAKTVGTDMVESVAKVQESLCIALAKAEKVRLSHASVYCVSV